MTIQVVILAAGLGKRMHSKLPKVLHLLAGKPLIAHVVETALKLSSERNPIIVCGHQAKHIQAALSAYPLSFVEQEQQLGTGHALLQALPKIAKEDRVLVLCGDVPLIADHTLKQLIATTPLKELGMLVANLQSPLGYGRIVRDAKQQIVGVVEEKDATDEQRAIKEINPGIYFAPAAYLNKWLPQLKNKNAQREYYLTDIIAHALADHIPIHAISPQCETEICGVNDQVQLAQLERFYQKQIAEQLMRQGLSLADPERFDVRGELKVGKDVRIDINCIIEGTVVLGDGCVIGPHVLLRHVQLGSGVEIKAHSVLDGVIAEADCQIGPFAHLRPETKLSKKVRIGNFVEIKKSSIDEGSKANHLSYIGDSIVGKEVNIGAGTITCNYDGANKHQTIIEDEAFIGSGTQLVAPLKIGKGATIGAGSTISKNAPAQQLTLTRAEQLTINSWQRPKKNK
jgi:bifunctional UDP-N-acetylglucosamine pyrophosphorylase / glucosamine-1-phosphate N-acetyltransferase